MSLALPQSPWTAGVRDFCGKARFGDKRVAQCLRLGCSAVPHLERSRFHECQLGRKIYNWSVHACTIIEEGEVTKVRLPWLLRCMKSVSIAAGKSFGCTYASQMNGSRSAFAGRIISYSRVSTQQQGWRR